jgi:hypothetical protein
VPVYARKPRSALLFREILPSITVSRLRSRIAFPTIYYFLVRSIYFATAMAENSIAGGRWCWALERED